MGVWARADDAAGLLEALGLGLYALRTDLRRVRARETRTVRASGSDPTELVVAYLTELLRLTEDDGFVAREVRARPAGRPVRAVTARLTGEPFDPARHSAGMDVKAITLHDLRFDPARGRARVIVDI